MRMDERGISTDHPLRKLFQDLVRRRFNREAQVIQGDLYRQLRSDIGLFE